MRELDFDVIEGKIKYVEYHIVGAKSTVCVITLESGFEVLGSSSCLDIQKFNQELGESLAYEEAFDKLVELEAYHITESEYEWTNQEEMIDPLELDTDIDTYAENNWMDDACTCEDEEEDDYSGCDCFDCQDKESCCDCECNEGCPHVGCPENEENDFDEDESYADDGTEEYPTQCDETCGSCDCGCGNQTFTDDCKVDDLIKSITNANPKLGAYQVGHIISVIMGNK